MGRRRGLPRQRQGSVELLFAHVAGDPPRPRVYQLVFRASPPRRVGFELTAPIRRQLSVRREVIHRADHHHHQLIADPHDRVSTTTTPDDDDARTTSPRRLCIDAHQALD